MEDKLTFARDLITSCSLPDLKADLDNTPLESGQFDEHRRLLDCQLPLLFDFIHHSDELLCSKEHNERILEIKGKLLLLTCELTAHNTLYKIRNEHFLEVLDKFIQNSFNRVLDSNDDVEPFILKQYTECLAAKVWKRHIGALHGFVRFLELKVLNGRILSSNWANFSLSVGLTVRECHLPVYKELSTTIFQAILSHSDLKEIKALNIHDVIFDSVLNSIQSVETVEGTCAIWRCLCDCLDLNEETTDSWAWGMTDEMMENLLRSIKYANNFDILISLLSFIPKILLRLTANRKEIEKFLARDYNSLSADDLEDFRLECSKISTCASYRWALYLLKLFIGESHTLLASAEKCEKLLQQFHVCYLTCIWIIPVEVMNINLLKFFEQFPNVLVEAIATHKETPRIRQLVDQIYVTFIEHLKKSNLEGGNGGFQQYYEALKKFVEVQCC